MQYLESELVRAPSGSVRGDGRVPRCSSCGQPMSVVYEELFDIEKRPGAGVALWTKAVEHQLERVREVNYRHRLHHSPNAVEKRKDPDAERHLHADVYFLALAIRRVLLFHDALAKQVQDVRLAQARQAFTKAAPNAKDLRDFYEHLDEYLLDHPKKHLNIIGRAAPVLLSRWDSDNVVVAFGPLRMDVTIAALAAIELGRASEVIWDRHLDCIKREQHNEDPPPTDDGIPRTIELTFGLSTVIGGDDNPPEITTGVLLGTRVREATDEEMGDKQP